MIFAQLAPSFLARLNPSCIFRSTAGLIGSILLVPSFRFSFSLGWLLQFCQEIQLPPRHSAQSCF